MVIQTVLIYTFNLYSEYTNRTNQITLSTSIKYSSFIIFQTLAITRSFTYEF